MRAWSVSLGLLVGMSLGLPLGDATEVSSSDLGHTFGWKAPLDFEGDLLVQVSVDYGPDNRCTLMAEAAGKHRKVGLEWVVSSDLRTVQVQSGGTKNTTLVQAHAGDVDTRELSDAYPGNWGARSWRGSASDDGRETWTFAGFDLQAWTFTENVYHPLGFEISCRDPFEVRLLQGSTSVLGFDTRSMAGIGASTDTYLGADASVHVQDGVVGTFDQEAVILMARDAVATGASVGHATLRYSGATGHFVMTTVTPTIDYQGVGGTYDLRFDRSMAARHDSFWGIMGGLDRVDDLDDIL